MKNVMFAHLATPLVALVALLFPSIGLSQVVYVVSDKVGVGTNSPVEKLHVKDGNLSIEQSGVDQALMTFKANGKTWVIGNNPNTGRLTFFAPGGGATTASFKFDQQAQENLFRVGVLAGDTVDITGKLVVNGSDITPDYVFEPDYPLESIEEHAESMWKNRHLPSLTSAEENETKGVNLVQHQFGVLKELEKAHIYIAQLNEKLKTLEEQLGRVSETSCTEQ